MILFTLLLTLDQYLKYLSLIGFSRTDYSFFSLTLTKNPGVSLGFLGNSSWILIISVQIALLIWVYTLKPPKYIQSFIFAGGISNIIDRLYYGYVIDYIHFKLGHWQWPAIVNLADLYITFAILLWLIHEKKSL